MADEKNTPFAVRMDQDEKERLVGFIQESGKNNKEFMSTLLNAYELNKTKAEIPELAQDITALQALTQQINDYYVNIGKRIDTMQKTKDLEFTKEIEIYKNRIETLNTENAEITNKFDIIQKAYNNISNDYEESKIQIQQLNDNLKDKTLLVEEYKNKNDMLLGQLTQYEKYPEKLEATKELLSKQQADNITLTDDLKQRDYNIEQLNNKVKDLIILNDSELNKLKTSHSEELTKLNEDHNNSLRVLKDKLELEKEKAILELKQIHQQELEKIQNKYNVDIAKYNTDYKNILEEMSKIKQSNRRTSASTKQPK